MFLSTLKSLSIVPVRAIFPQMLFIPSHHGKSRTRTMYNVGVQLFMLLLAGLRITREKIMISVILTHLLYCAVYICIQTITGC